MEQSNNLTLLPCPHCGKIPKVIHEKMYGWNWVYIVKCDCGAEIYARYAQKERAIEAWNEGDITLL